MTRAERAAAKRRNQIRRAKRRYRAKQRQAKAATAPVAEQPPAVDPIWSNEPATAPHEPVQPPAHDPVPAPEPTEPQEPKPTSRYIRRAARGPKPEEPVPLARAVDPQTGRRRVRIVIGDKTIDGEVGGDSIGGWDFEN